MCCFMTVIRTFILVPNHDINPYKKGNDEHACHCGEAGEVWTSRFLTFPLCPHILCYFFRKTSCNVTTFSNISRFPPPWESSFPPSLLSSAYCRLFDLFIPPPPPSLSVLYREHPMYPSNLVAIWPLFIIIFIYVFLDEIISLFKSYGLCGEVLMARKAGRERLSILKFTKESEVNGSRRWQVSHLLLI